MADNTKLGSSARNVSNFLLEASILYDDLDEKGNGSWGSGIEVQKIIVEMAKMIQNEYNKE